MVRLFSIIILTFLLTSCYQTTNRTIENEKKLRYNSVGDRYEYAEDDEQLKYNPMNGEYTYE